MKKWLLETLVVVLGVLLGESLVWVLGIRQWLAPLQLERWPWLVERCLVIFPVSLAVALLAIRRWTPVRTRFPYTLLGGVVAGMAAGLVATIIAQLVSAEHRTALLAGVRTTGLLDFFLLETTLVAFGLLGWLSGILASSMAFLLGLRLCSDHRTR